MIDALPSMELHDGPTSGIGVTDPCAHCGEPHVHGITDAPISHRSAHCEDAPGRGLGYFLLRPLRSLLNLPLRWWKTEGDGSGLFGGTEAPEGGGLLADALEDQEGGQ